MEIPIKRLWGDWERRATQKGRREELGEGRSENGARSEDN